MANSHDRGGLEIVVLPELGLPLSFGAADHFPVVMSPRAVFPIRTAGAERDLLALIAEMFLAIKAEARAMPDIGDPLVPDIAHAGIGRDVVAAHHHVAATVDVQPLENEWARGVVDLEIGRRIGGARGVEFRVRAPGQELAFDEIVDTDAVDPEALYLVDINALLVDAGRDDLRARSEFAAQRQHALNRPDENIPIEPLAHDIIGVRIRRIDGKLDHIDA